MQMRLSDNRARIIACTRALIARGGFRAASIASVATDAGLSTGAIYRYFPSQAQLFIEVLTAAVAREIELLERIAATSEPAATRLQNAVEAFAGRALDGRNLAYAFIAEPIGARVDVARMRSRGEFSEVFQRLLAAGVRSGEFPAQDVEVTAACIVGAFTEALVGPIAPGAKAAGPRARARLVAAIGRFCLAAVRA
ncbi:MAG TPA: TetR/AcrR family transcriptional regulator [Steroidobacteraceae bacterium]|jgi:AcrR family transcriptional regulator